MIWIARKWDKAEAKVVLGTNTLAYWTRLLSRKERFYEMDSEKVKWNRKQKLVSDQHSSLFDWSVIEKENVYEMDLQESEMKHNAKVVLGTNTPAFLTWVSLRKKKFY